MRKHKIYRDRRRIKKFLIIGFILGILFAIIEYTLRLNTEDPQVLLPLLIRGVFTGAIGLGLIATFDVLYKDRLMQKRFIYLVMLRSFVYTSIIIVCLIITNSLWFIFNRNFIFREEIIKYLTKDMFLINIITSYVAVIIIIGVSHINNLHRKGELINFILGRYHLPREVNRIFCFVDLKGSTSIAEKLGHFRFALFIKDFYSDITDAIRDTKAQVYQYVGDEIVLSWSFEDGIKNNNAVNCYFQMQELITRLKGKYLDKYGIYPEFKAGLHGGQVIVTWIGEVKKEIVYIGDVLNTTARIQEDCKRLGKDYLISEYLLDQFVEPKHFKSSFQEETIPRGKEIPVKLYSLEKMK